MTGEPNLIGARLGNYLLQKVLGRGQMGVVYLALDEALLRPTAVKVLAATAEQDVKTWALTEARSVARLNHPSVVQIYSVARQGAHRYIAMEYVEGASADVVVGRRGTLTAERATEIILQVASALELVHSSGILHRDVKPANILIRNDGTAKLGDFGMAIAIEAAAEGLRAGTPHYFAPEIWRNEPASVATDLYALGATYYHLLSGRPPYLAESIAALGRAHLQDEPAPLRGLTPLAAAHCMRLVKLCMAKSVKERARSAQQVTWEARGVLRDLAAAARPATKTVPLVLGDAAASAAAASAPLRPAGPQWQAASFRYEPFGPLGDGPPPYRGVPFDELRGLLAASLLPGETVVLRGARGSGRTTLAREVAAQWGPHHRFLSFDDGSADPLLARAARAFGAVPRSGPSDASLEQLLDALTAAAGTGRGPLLIVDGARADSPEILQLGLLARAARSTRCFCLLVVGELSSEDGLGRDAIVELPPLPPSAVTPYLEAWLHAARLPDAAPLLISPDAALLLGERSAGNLGALNELTRRAILASKLSSGGGVLTSWSVHLAAAPGPVARDGASAPAAWPPPAMLALINQLRRAARRDERQPAVPSEPKRMPT